MQGKLELWGARRHPAVPRTHAPVCMHAHTLWAHCGPCTFSFAHPGLQGKLELECEHVCTQMLPGRTLTLCALCPSHSLDCIESSQCFPQLVSVARNAPPCLSLVCALHASVRPARPSPPPACTCGAPGVEAASTPGAGEGQQGKLVSPQLWACMAQVRTATALPTRIEHLSSTRLKSLLCIQVIKPTTLPRHRPSHQCLSLLTLDLPSCIRCPRACSQQQ